MSVTLATVADALIEFILSLLRDPAAAAQFNEDPDEALNSRGLNNVSYADVCAVAPVIAERVPTVAAASVQKDPTPPAPPSPDPVVNEIRSIVNNLAYVDDRDTIIDQSVNQNIWADGDVTQVFDQEAVVASGDDAIAAGDDVDIEQTQDESTTINAGDDVNMGNDTTTTVTEDSNNTTTDSSTTTDAPTTVVVEDSGNDASTTTSAAESYNETAATTTDTTTDSDTTVVYESDDTTIADAPADDQF